MLVGVNIFRNVHTHTHTHTHIITLKMYTRYFVVFLGREKSMGKKK
jgi:hypothetical protein